MRGLPIQTKKQKFPRATALEVARELVLEFGLVCDRLIFAGSLRRKKSEVGDLEVLYIGKTFERLKDLLSTELLNLADARIDYLIKAGILEKRENAIGSVTFGPKNKLCRHCASGMPIDFFSATPANWWNYMVCRTGPAESNIRIASHAKAQGYKWNPYGEGFTRLSDGLVVLMESERDVFEFVGLPFHEPGERS